MLYHFLVPLKVYHTVFNVFQYITFRTVIAALSALFLGLLLGPRFIEAFRRKQIGERINPDLPQYHQGKEGTPTMGGTLILISVLVPTLLWCDLRNHFVWIAILVTTCYGLIGLTDDILKLKGNGSKA